MDSGRHDYWRRDWHPHGEKVEMTETGAGRGLHSFVGLAAVLDGFNSYLYHDASLARCW